MSNFNHIDIDVLKKFNQPGPRYTSYPTAPVFSEQFTPEDFEREVEETNREANPTDLSLYFHFPFCDTLCYFCGCNMMVTQKREHIAEYNRYLKKEIDRLVPLISKKRKVQQMHWGGGTPTYLEPDEIRDIGNYIKQRFDFADDIEASVEIDPRGLTRDHLVALREVGFNRTSFGVQDFNPQVQEAVNRIQSEELTRQTFEWARELGFQSINLDLIYGLPHQTLESFRETVEKVAEISPDRIAVFNYAHVPWLKKHQVMIKAEDLPSTDERLQILKMTIETLMRAGYEYIGMDHFAKPTDELAIAQKNGTLYRNFQGYSTKAGCDVYAFGLSAISQFQNIYAQNIKRLPDYYKRVDAGEPATLVGYRMTFDDHVRKETINQLMCHLTVDKRDVERQFNIDFDEYFAADLPKLQVFVDDGLLEITPDAINVLGAGILVIRNIAMCFDAYLEQMTAFHRFMNEKIGVVLLNLGGPDSLEAVEPFLFNLFNDPEIINFPLSFLFRKRLAKLISSKRHPRIQEQYKQIGGKSPLLELSEVQARLLEGKLNAAGLDARVYLAMRYWKPFTEDAVAAIERDGVERVVLLPLYPQYSKSTTGSSVKEWNRLTADHPRLKNIPVSVVEQYYDFPAYMDAVIERINQGLDRFPAEIRDEVHILFSAHGTPMKLVREGDPYSGQICETVSFVKERGAWPNPHTLCFQSKVGPQKWLTPSTPKVIEELAAQGTKHMLAVPIAFVSDHLETLFEIGKEFRHLATEKGVAQFEVTEGLNDSDLFAEALAQLVFQKVGKEKSATSASR